MGKRQRNGVRAAGVVTLAAALGGAFAACTSTSPPPAGLELVVATEGLSVPADFDDLQLQVSQATAAGGWEVLWNRDYLVPSAEAALPATFSVLAGPSPRVVRILVTGFHGGAAGVPVVQRAAEVQVPTDRLAELRLVLAAACKGQVRLASAGVAVSTCAVGESCQPSTGACGPTLIDVARLPSYVPGESLDAGAPETGALAPGDAGEAGDAGAPPEAGAEGGGADAAPESGVSCAPSVCTVAGAVCQDAQTVATCVEGPGGCLTVGSTAPCESPATCSGIAPFAACSLTCASSCREGETSCVAGGLATCTLGANGCWAYGAPAACAGARQSCSGAAGSAACACNADPTCSAAPGRCVNGATVATCVRDAQGCLYEGAAAACPTATPFCAAGACTASPPSCQVAGDGLTNCGASAGSCCLSPVVQGGTFYRTYDSSAYSDPASLSGFRLDAYEVTVGRFRRFVAAWNAGFRPAAGDGKHTYLNGGKGLANSASPGTFEAGWDPGNLTSVAPTDANLACGASYGTPTWTSSPGANEKKPITCANSWEATAFCLWDGGFLPSDAEWEYAAAGGQQQRLYPWGATAPGDQNQYAIYECFYPLGSAGSCGKGAVNIAPVGTPTLGAGRWGQFDLAGNVFELNADYFAGYVSPCVDCGYLANNNYRVNRGGGYANMTTSGSNDLLPTYRAAMDPSSRSSNTGFRCARSP